MQIKKDEQDFHDKEGSDYDLRWVKHPRYECHYNHMMNYVRSFFEAHPILVVDVGCGTGRGVLSFAEFGDIAIGLDISRELLKVLKAKIREKTKSHLQVELIMCDAEAIPLKRGLADLVTFWDVLHHLPNELKALSEARTILKEGRILTVHEPNAESRRIPMVAKTLLNGASHILWKLKNRSANNFEQGISPHERKLKLEEVVKVTKRCGFEIVEKRTVWFFGFIHLELPRKISNMYYVLANKIDSVLEKHIGKRAVALFVIARTPKT